jgi:Domain of unknown function (DUF4249)
MNFMRIYNLILLISSLLLQSCLEEVKTATRIEPNKLVIEGLISNDPTNQFLRLSLTKNYSNFTEIEPVKGAFVELRCKNSQPIKFTAQANEIGIYAPKVEGFYGQIGEEYSIYIKLTDGREFSSSPQILPNPVPIENLNSEFIRNPQFGFEIKLGLKDPSQTINFYRWTAKGYYQRKSIGVPVRFNSFCCNRCWVEKEEKAVNIFTDNLSNGNSINNIPVYVSPFYLLGQHLIEVNQFSISQATYQYWRKFKEQTSRTGTIFDPIPAPLFGNVVNIKNPSDIALGYFEVSGISKKRLEINDEIHGVEAIAFDNELYVPNGDCMIAFPYSVYVGQKPYGW